MVDGWHPDRRIPWQAAHRQVTVPGNTVFRVQDGKNHEMWIAFNPALLL